MDRTFNNCKNRNKCPNRHYCTLKKCNEYIEEKCDKLNKAPYVCNGCKNRIKCTLSKQLYDSTYVFNEYKDNLSEARSGNNFNSIKNNLNKF